MYLWKWHSIALIIRKNNNPQGLIVWVRFCLGSYQFFKWRVLVLFDSFNKTVLFRFVRFKFSSIPISTINYLYSPFLWNMLYVIPPQLALCTPTISNINSYFSTKSQTALYILHPRWRCPTWIRFQYLAIRSKSTIIRLPGPDRCLMTSSTVYIQYSIRMWQTDKQTYSHQPTTNIAITHGLKQ